MTTGVNVTVAQTADTPIEHNVMNEFKIVALVRRSLIILLFYSTCGESVDKITAQQSQIRQSRLVGDGSDALISCAEAQKRTPLRRRESLSGGSLE